MKYFQLYIFSEIGVFPQIHHYDFVSGIFNWKERFRIFPDVLRENLILSDLVLKSSLNLSLLHNLY